MTQLLTKCLCISGASTLRAFEQANPDNLTLEEHIDIAIDMAMKEAALKQVKVCSIAVSNCELIEPFVKRIRLYEAIGACESARIYK